MGVGAPFEDVGSTGDAVDAGAVNAIYGSAAGLTASGSQTFTQDSLAPGTTEEGDLFGWALANR